MCVLTRAEIMREIEEGRLRIEPFDPDQVGAASIDLHLDRAIRVLSEDENGPIHVTDEADRRRFVAETVRAFGALDILVNNAGAVATGPLAELSAETWRRLLDVNVTAPLLLVREAREELGRHGGVVINVATGAAVQPVAGFGAYGATKAALVHASKVLARELGPRNVTVNAVAPGFIETAMTEQLSDAQHEALRRNLVIPRLGTPEDVASAVAFLAGPDASYITGVVLNVSGGLYI